MGSRIQSEAMSESGGTAGAAGSRPLVMTLVRRTNSGGGFALGRVNLASRLLESTKCSLIGTETISRTSSRGGSAQEARTIGFGHGPGDLGFGQDKLRLVLDGQRLVFLLFRDGTSSTLLGASPKNTHFGFRLVGLQASSNVVADINIGDVDRDDFVLADFDRDLRKLARFDWPCPGGTINSMRWRRSPWPAILGFDRTMVCGRSRRFPVSVVDSSEKPFVAERLSSTTTRTIRQPCEPVWRPRDGRFRVGEFGPCFNRTRFLEPSG